MKPQTQAADGLLNEMDGNDPETLSNTVVNPGDVNNNERSTRRRAMFFEKVGGGKEIPFSRTLILYRKNGNEDYFTTGTLLNKITSSSGFRYEFSDDQRVGSEETHTFEYYLIPQLP